MEGRGDRGDTTKFTAEDGLISRMSENKVKQLCVPESRESKLAIVNNHHDTPTAALPGIERAANLSRCGSGGRACLKTSRRMCERARLSDVSLGQ
ncbi:uncharacterized protein PHALS_03290 [Plasmopara halstedii]|uniref:Uncharacterized protein n=1 Tax=Plasmopara halstedii TaxID=4781 RepID=A0A0N7L7C4_PLAHL|nr:uncharacterized protein PHALS_03290 [Plasmopara halstedii]CEG46683.1 hypothetical protein PHALS_03290 [Plasmopara halstedii]|eukprot:XP_024583052.1 hypothetical protein PHALS_03290 [Plasmopara halstedii]